MAETARDDLQRQADGYVRQGRLDAAIDVYEQVARATPTDWNLIKQIADLQERAGRREAAAARFLQCADHYFGEGFLARAAALYRKVLKLDVKSEHALGKLADVSVALKLKMDARQALSQLVVLRSERGDAEGAREAAARLAALEPEGARELDTSPAPDVAPKAAPVEPVEPVELAPDSLEDLLQDSPAPLAASADVPAVAPPGPLEDFDWGALLGRDVPPASLVPSVSAPGPIPPDLSSRAVLADRSAEPTAGPAPDDEAAAEVVSVEEIDLTDLLDQLALERSPTPTPRSGDDLAAPAEASPDAPDAGDFRVLAARHLAAGRVFAAAGLAAEAARAFERASRDLRTRFEAAEALASLHRSRGQMGEAVRWYDEAARAPVADEAVRRPVLYDLAEVLETAGQPGRALAVLLDLLSEVEDYRDARARADRLLRVDAGG